MAGFTKDLSASYSGTSLPAVLCGSVMFRWEVVCGCKEVDLLSVCNVVREPALPLPWWRGWLTKMCNVYIHYTAHI